MLKGCSQIVSYLLIMIPYVASIFLAFGSTQTLWTNRKYFNWTVSISVILLLYFYLTPLHTNINTIPILLMPIYWIILSFICAKIYSILYQRIQNSNFKRPYLIFVFINTANSVYEKKLGNPSPVDYIFSAIVYIGVLCFAAVIGFLI